MIGWIGWIVCAATWLAIAIRVRKLTQARMARATELALLKSGYELDGKI
jgi:uncharacterized membrane protein YciS (DUF1049 family)